MYTDETYDMLLDLLEAGAARYRLTGRARGPLPQPPATGFVVRIQFGEKGSRFVVAVVPGDRRVALETVREMWGGTSASFATRETAEELSGCTDGTVIPFSLRTDVALVVDEDLLAHREIHFNAARLDESIVLVTDDYVRLARPRIARISEPEELAEAS